MKKWLSILLVLSLLFAFAACAQEEDVAEEDVTTTEEEEINPFEEFMEISWLTQLNEDWRDGRWDQVRLEERFNVKLNVWPRDSNRDREGMAALVAAGEIPDFFFMPGAPIQPQEFYDEGLTRSIPVEMFRDYLPGYYRLLEMMPIGFSYNLVAGKTDEYLGITHIGFASAQYFYDGTAINLDWLESAGYQFDEGDLKPVRIPTEGFEDWSQQLFIAEGNFDFNDMNEMLRAFTEDDPNNTGVDDTFGMLYLPETATTNMTQTGIFGFVHHNGYLYEDPTTGDIVPHTAYTPYRDYLAWVSESLERGYMRRLPGEEGWYAEYQQITRTNAMGIMQIHRDGYLYPTNPIYTNLPPQNVLLETDETARFVIGPMFSGPDGKKVNMTYSIDTYGVGLSRVEMVGAQVDDAKLERILHMIEYMLYTDEDTYYFFLLGIEGIHWHWSGEPYYSTQIMVPESELPEEYHGYTRVFPCWLLVWPTTERDTYNAINHGYWSMPSFMYAFDLYEKYALVPAKFISPIYMGAELHNEYLELHNEYNPQIAPIVADFKNRALNGEIANFNTEWTTYIDQLYAAGLEKLVEQIYNNPDYPAYDPGDKFKVRGPLY